jgi:hypothetical protein
LEHASIERFHARQHPIHTAQVSQQEIGVVERYTWGGIYDLEPSGSQHFVAGSLLAHQLDRSHEDSRHDFKCDVVEISKCFNGEPAA